MTEKETETTEQKEIVEIPSVSWLLTDYIRASDKEILEKTVNCTNCPVFILCETGQGGTGWTCSKCNATGVYLDTPKEGANELPEHVLVIDCGKHKFEKKKECAQITECSLCSGGLMELEVLNKGTKNHYIRTVHAYIAHEQRKKVLLQGWNYWSKFWEEKNKTEKKEEE